MIISVWVSFSRLPCLKSKSAHGWTTDLTRVTNPRKLCVEWEVVRMREPEVKQNEPLGGMNNDVIFDHNS